MPTDATALLAILRETCGNGAANVLRAIDDAGWAVVPKVAGAEALACIELEDTTEGIYAAVVEWGALRLPADGGKDG